MSTCACKPAFALVLQGGVTLPCHPPCCSVQPSLRQSLCLHVERRDARREARWGQRLLSSPLLKMQTEVTHPALKHCWLLPLQGLDHLLWDSWGRRDGRGLYRLCTWQQSGEGEGQNCLPLSPLSRWDDTLRKLKLRSPLWASRMQGSGWDGFRSAAAAKETLWAGCVFVCVLQINHTRTSEHDYSFLIQYLCCVFNWCGEISQPAEWLMQHCCGGTLFSCNADSDSFSSIASHL